MTMRAIWHDVVLAESDDTVVVEGNHYFPRESLREEYFLPSNHRSVPLEGCGLLLLGFRRRVGQS